MYSTVGERMKKFEPNGGNFSGKFTPKGSRFKIDAKVPWQNSMPFSDRDRSLKQVRT
jgi:hypothetical protein